MMVTKTIIGAQIVLNEDEANVDNDSNNPGGVPAKGRHCPCFHFL